ncbi:hypothetical protein NDU88_002355 [Pleurodeles waltl]|uniref:Uncharacterized protein n=1 Tax=Pleurodeles waltl TaxID=8319 RepID=A0AAV7NF76_PLEWA|nr:hypothetical protein NDU88_002355 [Pleurodeles waltl]
MEVKEKIWKGTYTDIFDLLVDKSEKDEVKRCKECAQSRECGHWPHKRKVEESLNNWVRASSTFQAIIADRFDDQGAQLACYQNRIVGAHDEYGGPAWNDYDNELRRIKANKPIPFTMVASENRGEKRLHTEELFEALMLGMDAMDQAIESLRAQPAISMDRAVRLRRDS